MTRSVALAHTIRHDDGTTSGVWGGYELKSAFQPIFAFDDGKLRIAAFEGLIRPFKNGSGVSPGVFFGAIPAQDRMHVETLARTLHLLNGGRLMDPRACLFVNFDPSLFRDHAVTDTVLRDMRIVLHEAEVQPERIVCEVTERRSGSESALFDFVAALRTHGFRVAVDDYGAEDSDMARIKRLRPDIVKFDAQWITALMRSGPGFGLLSAMVRTFADQGIETVFEGIEEGWQLELAERSGASMLQGFVLARPELVPANFASFPFAEPKRAAPAAAAAPAADSRSAGPVVQPARPVRAFGRRVAAV